jgi:nucleoside-diphosphate-sugar epimerase
VTSASRTIAITGATGLVGRHLCEYFRRRGWNVRALMRDTSRYPFTEPGIDVYRADLPHAFDERALHGADAVIHAAYSTTATRADVAKRVNEEGTMQVLSASRSAGVRRFVFVSSFAAHANARSYYGRSKFELEQLLDSQRDLVIRPGLVLAPTGGLFERLRNSLQRSAIVPLFGGGKQILQTVHIDDACLGFERAIDRDLTGALNIAEPEGITMKSFIKRLAARLRKRVVLIPVPAQPTVAFLQMFERAGVQLPVSSENVLGLLAMRHTPTAPDLARLDLRVRTTEESLSELMK